MTIDASHGTAVKDLQQLVDRYVALWNEPDPDIRRHAIRELWAPDGFQVLVDPPEEVRDAADRLAFAMPTLEVHGIRGGFTGERGETAVRFLGDRPMSDARHR